MRFCVYPLDYSGIFYFHFLESEIPVPIDFQSSFFAHFMCFEVPALVPPGSLANGNGPGSNDDEDDDLGIMDIDDADSKPSNTSYLFSLRYYVIWLPIFTNIDPTLWLTF